MKIFIGLFCFFVPLIFIETALVYFLKSLLDTFITVILVYTIINVTFIYGIYAITIKKYGTK